MSDDASKSPSGASKSPSDASKSPSGASKSPSGAPEITDNPVSKLWRKLRLAQFTRIRIEHIIATLLNWQQDPDMDDTTYQVYKRRMINGKTYNRQYWFNLREFIGTFGNKNNPYQSGRFFVVKKMQSGDFPSRVQVGRADENSETTPPPVVIQPTQIVPEILPSEIPPIVPEILPSENSSPGIPANVVRTQITKTASTETQSLSDKWQLRIHMPWRNYVTQVPEERDFIVIAKEDTDALLASVYTDPRLAAFHGRDRIYKLMSEQFVGISRDAVMSTIKRHEASQIRHPATAKQVRQPGTEARFPNHRWQLDYTGDTYSKVDRTLQETILVVVDCFSRYVWAIVVKTKGFRDDATQLEFLKSLFLREGAPRVLQGDGAFSSLDTLCEEFGTQLSIDKPHHWQAHGQIERFNRSIQGKLRLLEADKYTESVVDTKERARILRDVVASMNSLSSTILGGLSPFQVYRGRNPSNPSTRLDNHLSNIGNDEEIPTKLPAPSDVRVSVAPAAGPPPQDEDTELGYIDSDGATKETKEVVPEIEAKSPGNTSKSVLRYWSGRSGDAFIFKPGDIIPGFYVDNTVSLPSDLIGRRISKIFPGQGRFEGTITSVDLGESTLDDTKGDTVDLFTVLYDDGDTEDLEMDEIRAVLLERKIWTLLEIEASGTGIMNNGDPTKIRRYIVRYTELKTSGDFKPQGRKYYISEAQLMEDVLGAMSRRWQMGEDAIQLSTGLKLGTENLLSIINIAKNGQTKQVGDRWSYRYPGGRAIKATQNSTLQSLYALESTWRVRLMNAIANTDTNSIHVGFGTTFNQLGGSDDTLVQPLRILDESNPVVQFYRARYRATRNMINKIREKFSKERKQHITASQMFLDRRQGAVKVYDIVRILQRSRDDPEDEYGLRPGRTVGNVYRDREKGGELQWSVDKDRTDPFRLRDKWSTELFIVTRVVYLRHELRADFLGSDVGIGPSNIRISSESNLIDADSIAPTIATSTIRAESLLSKGIVPRYKVRRIDLKSSSGIHVDLLKLRAVAANMLERDIVNSAGTEYPHFKLATYELDAVYFRRDILRIPQDTLHRFRKSVNNLPRTQRSLPALRTYIPTRGTT